MGNINFELLNSSNPLQQKWMPKTVEDVKKLKDIRDKLDLLHIKMCHAQHYLPDRKGRGYVNIEEYINIHQREWQTNNTGYKYMKKRFYLSLELSSVFLIGSWLGIKLLKNKYLINPIALNLFFINFCVIPGSYFVYWSYKSMETYRIGVGLGEEEEYRSNII